MMSNGSEHTDNEEMSLGEQFQSLLNLYGVAGDQEEADPDEQYAIFTTGDHADQTFRRLVSPSYGQQERVANILLKVKHALYPESSKQALCNHLNIDKKMIEDTYSQKELDEKILPLIVREELPKGWDIKHASSAEVERMRIDFLSDT